MGVIHRIAAAWLIAALGFAAGVLLRPFLGDVRRQIESRGERSSTVMDRPLYARRTEQFAAYVQPRRVVFLGDSRIQEAEWSELLGRCDVSNRGISGDTTTGVLARLNESVPHFTTVCVLQMGINDLKLGAHPEVVVENYSRIIQELVWRKRARVILMPILLAGANDEELNARIRECNEQLRVLAAGAGVLWLDVNAALCPGGVLPEEFSPDGVHLNAAGYRRWVEALMPLLRAALNEWQ